ncbi:unnamed protein product [Pedinophyceae sp. YPF-701]|nr:unnamed protein product [Pedinophyceae sp. YPF-701]
MFPTLRRLVGIGADDAEDRTLWMDDHTCKVCYECDTPFTILLRRHHCRVCGRIFCHRCTQFLSLAPGEPPKRVCNFCFSLSTYSPAGHSNVAPPNVISPRGSIVHAAPGADAPHAHTRGNNNAGPDASTGHESRADSLGRDGGDEGGPRVNGAVGPAAVAPPASAASGPPSQGVQHPAPETRKPLLDVARAHCEAVMRLVFDRWPELRGLPHEWRAAAAALAWDAATRLDLSQLAETGEGRSPLRYIQVVGCVDTAAGADAAGEVVSGAVLARNVAHRRMRTHVDEPRVACLLGALEYHRTTDRLSSLDTLLEQEREYLAQAVEFICRAGPSVLLVEGTVARHAQQLLLERGVSLALNIGAETLERVARLTRGRVAATLEQLEPRCLGTCASFHILPARHAGGAGRGADRPLMVFDGCDVGLGGTVLVRAPSVELLPPLTSAVEAGVVTAVQQLQEALLMADTLAVCAPAAFAAASEREQPGAAADGDGARPGVGGADAAALARRAATEVARWAAEAAAARPGSYVPRSPYAQCDCAPAAPEEARGAVFGPVQVLYRKANPSRGVVCCPPSRETFDVLGARDVSLGAFLLSVLRPAKAARTCSHARCGDGPAAHLLTWALGNARVTAAVYKIDESRTLPGAGDGHVWMWAAPRTNPAGGAPADSAQSGARRVLLSPAVCGISIGHFFELLLSASAVHVAGMRLHGDYIRFLGVGRMVLRLQQDALQPLAALLPPQRQVPHDGALARRRAVAEARALEAEVASVYSAVDAAVAAADDGPGAAEAVEERDVFVRWARGAAEVAAAGSAEGADAAGGAVEGPWVAVAEVARLRCRLAQRAAAWSQRLAPPAPQGPDGAMKQLTPAWVKLVPEGVPPEQGAVPDAAGSRGRADSGAASPALPASPQPPSPAPPAPRRWWRPVASVPQLSTDAAQAGDASGSATPATASAAAKRLFCDAGLLTTEQLLQSESGPASDLTSADLSGSNRDSVGTISAVPEELRRLHRSNSAAEQALPRVASASDASVEPAPPTPAQGTGRASNAAGPRMHHFISNIPQRLDLGPLQGMRQGPSEADGATVVPLGSTASAAIPGRALLFEGVAGAPRRSPATSSAVPVPVYDSEPASIIAHALAARGFASLVSVARQQLSGGAAAVARPRSQSRRRSATGVAPAAGLGSGRLSQPLVGDGGAPPRSGTPPLPASSSTPSVIESREGVHVRYAFTDASGSGAVFQVEAYFAAQFEEVRALWLPGGSPAAANDGFVASLLRCQPWQSGGGRSGSYFAKTWDDRLVLKAMSRPEKQAFLQYAPEYLAHVAGRGDRPTCLARILGAFTVVVKNPSGAQAGASAGAAAAARAGTAGGAGGAAGAQGGAAGQAAKPERDAPRVRDASIDLLVMENVLAGRRPTHVYDLKGSTRNRHQAEVGASEAAALNGAGGDGEGGSCEVVGDVGEGGDARGRGPAVLWDQNLLETLPGEQIWVDAASWARARRALWEDTSFLSKLSVMDYSLLAGVDPASGHLVLGVIDFLRQFTWDKQLETWVKSSGILGGVAAGRPTVISPEQYMQRFREAMDLYFSPVPAATVLRQAETGPEEGAAGGAAGASAPQAP